MLSPSLFLHPVLMSNCGSVCMTRPAVYSSPLRSASLISPPTAILSSSHQEYSNSQIIQLSIEKMPTPSLLGLPLELRLAIYDCLLYEETQVRYAQGDNRKQECLLYTRASIAVKYHTSWCNAMLVCRQLRTELDEYLAKQKETPQGSTWISQMCHH